MQTDLLGILPEISTLMGAEKGAPLWPVFLGALLFVPLPRHNTGVLYGEAQGVKAKLGRAG